MTDSASPSSSGGNWLLGANISFTTCSAAPADDPRNAQRDTTPTDAHATHKKHTQCNWRIGSNSCSWHRRGSAPGRYTCGTGAVSRRLRRGGRAHIPIPLPQLLDSSPERATPRNTPCMSYASIQQRSPDAMNEHASRCCTGHMQPFAEHHLIIELSNQLSLPLQPTISTTHITQLCGPHAATCAKCATM